MSTTWFQVKVLDDLGRPVDGVALFFDLPSGKRQLITNSTGVARLDGVVEGDGSVRFADLPALREKLHSRWRDVHGKPAPFRPAPADEPDVVFVPLADHIEAHPLRFETPLTIVLLPVVLRVRLVGLYFDTDKTFLLPSAMHGIRRMRKFYERYPNMELLIVGHTDQNGDPQYNDELSLLRAKSVKQFLTDDVDGWMKWYEPETPWSRRWGTSEDRRMLETLPEAAPPYLGAGDSYYHAITRFQADKGLPTSGLADAQTRRALVADYMALDHTTLPAGVQVTIHGCGEAFPEVAGDVSGPSDARDAANRRVELYLFDGPVYPAPDGPISGPTAVDYPAWRHYLIETYDFSVDDPPLHTFRIRMHDARRQRLLPSSFAAIGPAAEIYRADADAWIEFELHDEDALVAIQWGADDPAGPFPFRASIYVVFDEEPNLRARAQLHNLGYPALQDFDYAVWRFEVDNHLPENGLYDGVVAPTTRARLEQIYTPENCDAVK